MAASPKGRTVENLAVDVCDMFASRGSRLRDPPLPKNQVKILFLVLYEDRLPGLRLQLGT